MIFRGEVYLADLSHSIGSEQGGTRPVLIIQNDTGNKHSPTVIIASITSKDVKVSQPTHVIISASHNGLLKDSKVMLEQLRTIDKSRIQRRLGRVSPTDMKSIDNALFISLGLNKDI